LKTLEEREIDRREAERTLKAPEKVIPGRSPREILIRRYNDVKLQQEMALWFGGRNRYGKSRRNPLQNFADKEVS
jgi:hypothetical protein